TVYLYGTPRFCPIYGESREIGLIAAVDRSCFDVHSIALRQRDRNPAISCRDIEPVASPSRTFEFYSNAAVGCLAAHVAANSDQFYPAVDRSEFDLSVYIRDRNAAVHSSQLKVVVSWNHDLIRHSPVFILDIVLTTDHAASAYRNVFCDGLGICLRCSP